MDIYKISLNRQLKYLQPLIIGFVALILIVLFSINKYGFKIDIFIFFGLVFLIIGLFPVLFIHIDYYLKNKNVLIKINYLQNKFDYNGKMINFNNIEKIEMHQSSFKLNRDIQFLPTVDYHYSKIILKNGDILYVTCLLAEDFDLGLKNKVVYRQRIIASIEFES